MTPSAAQLDEFRAVIGAGHVLTAPDDLAPYLREDRGRWRGAAGAVLRPADTDEAARLVAICAAGRIPLVPQGGNTGLVGGGMAEGGVVISTGRMSRIRALDALNATITVEAGATLLSVQEAARGAGLLFPLSLASEGSCQIGGNLATNAGGTAVLRYGTMRDLTLGIEAVMPDGRVMDLLGGLRKDNTGYALRDLLIGSEGTLGLITAATLRLFPAPAQRATAFIAAPGPHEALALFDLMRNRCGESLSAFEYLERFGLQIVLDHLPGARDPLAEPSPSYVLAELTSPDPESDLSARFEAALAEAFERGLITDAAIGASEAQGAALWQLREAMSEMQKHVGASIKHDVAVPVSRVADFITEAVSACRAHMPGLRPCPFGHFGDGNIHFNLTRPEVMEDAEFLDHYPAFNRIVHDIVASMGGSISAEHGIGQAKRGELLRYKDPVALDLFRAVKAAIDPLGIMNPGKLIPPA